MAYRFLRFALNIIVEYTSVYYTYYLYCEFNILATERIVYSEQFLIQNTFVGSITACPFILNTEQK